MEPIRAALVQMESEVGNPSRNLDRMLRWMEQARCAGAQLVCFPEACLTGYSSACASRAAIGLDDPIVAQLRHAAASMRIAVSFGLMEARADRLGAKPYVTHVVVDGCAGEAGGVPPCCGTEGVRGASPSANAESAVENPLPVLVYRKTHLGASEQGAFSAGDALPVAQVAGSVIGVQLCWESHIPDISTALRAQGAEILLAPFASPLGGKRRRLTWERFLPTRAYDNGAFVLAVNAVTRDSAGECRGGGLAAFGPDGAELASAYASDSQMALCDLDGILPRDPDARGGKAGMAGVSYFDHRRPELYCVD